MKKRKFRRLALFITLVPVAYFLFIIISFSLSEHTISTNSGTDIRLPTEDTAFRNGFFHYNIDDSLPHYQYRKIEDSFKAVQFGIDRQNKGYLVKSSYSGFMGFTKLKNPLKQEARKKKRTEIIVNRIDSIDKLIAVNNDPDSIAHLSGMKKNIIENWNYAQNDEITDTLSSADFDYFLTLRDYRLPYDNKFFVQNGNYYIAYLSYDNPKKTDTDKSRVAYYKRKQIQARYHETENTVSIPVSKYLYHLLNSTAFILTILFFIASFYIIIGLPASILVAISKGRAFTEQNIKDLKIICWFVTGYGILKTISPILEEWVFAHYLQGNFIGKGIINSFFSSLPLLLSGLAVFLIRKAFQKGYKLQQEQDYTV